MSKLTCTCYGECGTHSDKCEDAADFKGLMTIFVRSFCSTCALELAKKLIEQLSS